MKVREKTSRGWQKGKQTPSGGPCVAARLTVVTRAPPTFRRFSLSPSVEDLVIIHAPLLSTSILSP